ncbi:NlpC/P60 family protein [Pelosinus sp. IPA-1]|uniref:C40 family peptidase n=1 Tax=Pelosinus sp. IPA-1 TaxID=3029569 RepID=UPI0024362A4F|nr:NlpC/P60 family protein [Pelosinus sp. IPA-1]GMA99282.1 hydrolase [Pelosinus sp. IPA-1]
MKTIKLMMLFIICSSIFFILPSTTQAESLILSQGMSGNAVHILQSKLKEYGFYFGEINEFFDANTWSAVIKFQRACNLPADGIVGEQTYIALHQFKYGDVSSRGQILRKQAIDIGIFAKKFYDIPYVWAGSSPSGFDCSGFIYYIFNEFGILIPRMADEQFEMGLAINQSDLQTGDIVFFSTYEPGPSHVGIYIGNGQFIHASSAAGKVTITDLSKPYYQSRYLGARRII